MLTCFAIRADSPALSIVRPLAAEASTQPAGSSNAATACPAPAPALPRVLAADARLALAPGLPVLAGPAPARSRCCNAPPGRGKEPPHSVAPPRWRWRGPGGGQGDRVALLCQDAGGAS